MEKISVVVSCYNEEKALPLFYEEMERVIKQDFDGIAEFEYIFVNDGSKDKTLEIMKSLRAKDSKVRYVSFSRNFGKEAAMLAGLEAATGDYVTLMDADLQDPPTLLKQMYDAIINEGYDAVGTRRVTRKGEPPIRSFFARMFYKIINKRVYKMIDNGLVQEVKNLYTNYPKSKILKRAIGYKEIIDYLDNKITLEEAVDEIKKNSRHYAKRQYTWFNNKMDIKWFEVNFNYFNETIDNVKDYLNSCK